LPNIATAFEASKAANPHYIQADLALARIDHGERHWDQVRALDTPDDALKYAQQAGEISPDNAAVGDTLGWVCYRNGLYVRAVDYLKKAVEESLHRAGSSI